MTATIAEVQSGSIAASTTGTFNLATTLVSSDVIVVSTSRTTLGVITPTGLGGATFTTIFSGAANARVLSHYATGVTGAGQSVSVTASTDAMGITVHVVRGLNSVTVTEQHSVWSSATTASNTDEFTPSQSFGTDQVAILIANTTASGTATMPSNSTPSGGWTSDLVRTTSPRFYVASQVATTGGGTVIGGIRSTATIALGITCIVLGTETTSSPLTSTFVGWGNPIF